jgi:hypothetical protein
MIYGMQTRALLVAPALAGLAGLSLLVSACGSSGPGVVAVGTTTTSSTIASASSAGSTHEDAALAFSRCMRTHGVPSFPDPDAQGNLPSFHAGVSKQISAAADVVCKHLLPSGGTGTPQEQQQKFAFALKVAQCLRTHGFPTFPDPTVSGERIPPGIDTQSPPFQTAETRCEQHAREALGLP